jgi:hypothetical protein
MISVNINDLEGKLSYKTFSIIYCFGKREGGVPVTADLRTCCIFDAFYKKNFHISYESDVSSSPSGCSKPYVGLTLNDIPLTVG